MFVQAICETRIKRLVEGVDESEGSLGVSLWMAIANDDISRV